MSSHQSYSVYSNLDNPLCYLHTVGGYLGKKSSSVDTGLSTIIADRIKKTHDSYVFRINNKTDLHSDVLIRDYVPPEGSSWLFVVEFANMSSQNRSKILKLARNTAGLHKIWLFLVPYSDTKDGYPLYNSLVNKGFSGYWGTYMRYSDIQYMLRDSHMRPSVLGTVAWLSKIYNRDVSVICSIYNNFDIFAESIDALPDTHRRRLYVTTTYGVSTSSPLEYTNKIIHKKAKFDQGYRLYMSNPETFKSDLLRSFNTLIREKTKSVLHKPYKRKYKKYLDDVTLPYLLQLREKIERLTLSDPSDILFLTKRGQDAVL